MRTRAQPILGPFARQVMAWGAISLLVAGGRWAQGGDRPIALGLRLIYAAAILAAVAFVARGFALAFPRVYRGYRRIARRARERPGLTVYFSVLGLVAIVAALSSLSRDLRAVVTGGDFGIVGFTGDNSADIKQLLLVCLILCNVGCLFACLAVDRWRRSRLDTRRPTNAPTEPMISGGL